MTGYVLDTNLYVDALRNAALGRVFLEHFQPLLPRVHMSSVVVQELLSGAQTPGNVRRLERELLASFDRTGRLIAPSREAWRRSGTALAALARREGIALSGVTKSFANDLLLALSCRESGLTLITQNLRDFARIRRVVEFAFVPPWP